MTGYPPPGYSYPYGASAAGSQRPPAASYPYSSGPPPPSAPYASVPPPTVPYASSAPLPSVPYASSAPPPSAPYGSSSPPSAPYGLSPTPYGSTPAPYGASPLAILTPSTFPPGTDPNIIACFQAVDRDRSGLIDDLELQSALSSYNQSFSLRTVHLLMYLFGGTNVRKIGPKEFCSVFYCLQSWRGIFERFDRDRSGKIDTAELREALLSLGFAVSPVILDMLVFKFDKSGGQHRAIEYDHFIECCLTVKGLTEKFREKDTTFTGTATFSYEAFMLTVLPFLIA